MLIIKVPPKREQEKLHNENYLKLKKVIWSEAGLVLINQAELSQIVWLTLNTLHNIQIQKNTLELRNRNNPVNTRQLMPINQTT